MTGKNHFVFRHGQWECWGGSQIGRGETVEEAYDEWRWNWRHSTY